MAGDIGAGEVAMVVSRCRVGWWIEGDQQDPLRSQMDGGAERAQLMDGAVAVELVADMGGRKDKGERRGGEQMIRGEQGAHPASSGSLPGMVVGPSLKEGGGEAVVVIGCRDGERLQTAVEDVVIDAVIVDELIQQAAQRRIVEQMKGVVGVGIDEAGRAFVHQPPQQASRVKIEDVVGFEAAPDPLQLAHPQMKAGGVAGERGDVDGPGRGAAQNGKGDAEIARIELRHGFEGTDLIGGARSASGEQQRCIGSGHMLAPYCWPDKDAPTDKLTIRRCIEYKNGRLPVFFMTPCQRAWRGFSGRAS